MNLLRKLLTILVVLATVVAGVLFALQNTALVPLDLLVYTFAPKSLALWVLAAFATGGVLGMLTASGIILRLRTSVLMANKRTAKAMSELDTLRARGSKNSE
ncbi:MAG: LapA family protein [Halioglobus sp.]